MKPYLLVIIFNFFYLCATASTLHLILVADTTDSKIRAACLVNHERIEKYMTDVAGLLNYNLNLVKVVNKHLTFAAIKKNMAGLHIDSNDIIFFHYSGHGMNSQKNKWPRFLIDDPTLEADLKNIHSQLSKKKPRLLISIADCCNIKSERPRITQVASKTESVETPSFDKTSVELFKKFKGEIIASGSLAGQFSYYEQDLGGYFTTALIYTLRNRQKGEDWATILEKTKTYTQNMTLEINHHQTPQYDIQKYQPPVVVRKTAVQPHRVSAKTKVP